jgi:TRAP-type uncharacterized transport system substrate-binding protein
VIAGLYAEAVQLVTMDPAIKSVADLAGKSVSIGAPGSGVYFNALDVLTAAGLTLEDINPQYQSFADSADALKDGKIDAAFIVAGPPTPAITELCNTNDAYLVPIDGEIADKLMADCPFYTVHNVPAGTYKGQTEDDINAQYQSFADSTDALKDGKIDAAFIVAGPPTPAITELCTTNDAYLVPIDGEIADKLMADCPFYTAYSIPAGTYPGQDADVATVTVKATLIVSADADEDDVYKLTKAIFDNIDAIAAENAKGNELSIENAVSGMSAPFHKGAAKYFAEKGFTVNAG